MPGIDRDDRSRAIFYGSLNAVATFQPTSTIGMDNGTIGLSQCQFEPLVRTDTIGT